MRWSQSKNYRIHIEDQPQYKQGQRKDIRHQHTKNNGSKRTFNAINLFFAGLRRWFIAGKYHTHRIGETWLSKSNILWLKIGVAGFAILMVYRNDFKFTVNLSGSEAAEQPYLGETTDQMGMAQTIALKPTHTNKRQQGQRKAIALSPKNINIYIDMYTPVAQSEMRRFGIPASLKMAFAILASSAGQNPASQIYNNHFGRHLKGVNFDDAATNWRAHSLYLLENYPELNQAGQDYIDWIKALTNTNYYADDPSKPERLLEIIQTHKLYKLDY